jgi:hypothetical protein
MKEGLMSSWIEIKDPEDVEVVDDEIQIRYDADHTGNKYIYFKVAFVKSKLPSEEPER